MTRSLILIDSQRSSQLSEVNPVQLCCILRPAPCGIPLDGSCTCGLTPKTTLSLHPAAPLPFLRELSQTEVWGSNNPECNPSVGTGIGGPVPQTHILRGVVLTISPHSTSEGPSGIKPKWPPGAPLTGSSSFTLPPAVPSLLLPGTISQLNCLPPSTSGTAFKETQTEIWIPFVHHHHSQRTDTHRNVWT